MPSDAHPSPAPDGIVRPPLADRRERAGLEPVGDADVDPSAQAGAGARVDAGPDAGTEAVADVGVRSSRGDPAGDEARLAAYAAALADGVVAALPRWVASCVERVLVAWSGTADAAVMDQARAAGDEAAAVIGPELRALLACDIDEQRTNPLAVVRRAVVYPTAVLRAAGVPAVVRDADAEARFPDDDYDLVPAAFADLDPALHEPGLVWGAAKAHVHLARRRAEGRR